KDRRTMPDPERLSIQPPLARGRKKHLEGKAAGQFDLARVDQDGPAAQRQQFCPEPAGRRSIKTPRERNLRYLLPHPPTPSRYRHGAPHGRPIPAKTRYAPLTAG